MKIIISEKESYEMDIPVQLNLQEFIQLVKRLDVVVQMINPDTSAKKTSPASKVATQSAQPRFYARVEIVELLKALFNPTESNELDNALAKYKINIKRLHLNKFRWLKIYSIQPGELGLEKLPEKHQVEDKPEESEKQPE